MFRPSQRDLDNFRELPFFGDQRRIMTDTRIQFFDEPHVMQPGVVADYLGDFAAHLGGQGYQSLSISNYLWPAAHFGGWVDANGLSLDRVTDETLAAFRDHYCQCPGKRKFKHVSRPYIARTLYFIEYLRGRSVIKTEPVPSEPLPGCIAEFSDWLLQHRGSAAATIKQHCRMLRKILRAVGDDPTTYDAATVRQAAIACTTGCGRPLAKRIITTFRMYLRFLSTTSKVRPYLDRALPTVPQWKLSSLPRHMEPKFIPWLIASCDTDKPTGMRDRAVLLLLVRLGLRPGDIVTMGLDDIEWIHGTSRVRGKSRREVRLPLPQDAGDALLTYLENRRPAVAINRVSLCATAPFRPFQCSTSVSGIVSVALHRAGIMRTPSRGATLLRHTAATMMLRGGATLDVIGSVLRHRSPDTTAHYAKVDINRLRQIAQPWPEDNLC